MFEFYCECTGITLQLTDNYKVRNDILGQLQRNANTWFELALSRAPIELQSTLQVRFVIVTYSFSFIFSLQKHLTATRPLIGADAAELGVSVAETFAKASGSVHRQLCRCSLNRRTSDLIILHRSLCVACQTGSLIVHVLSSVNLRANAIFQGKLLVWSFPVEYVHDYITRHSADWYKQSRFRDKVCLQSIVSLLGC